MKLNLVHSAKQQTGYCSVIPFLAHAKKKKSTLTTKCGLTELSRERDKKKIAVCTTYPHNDAA